MNMHTHLTECNVAIVKHTYTPTGGAEQELLRFLLPLVKSITYVSHPFADARGVALNSKISVYETGELREEFLAPLITGPFPLLAAKDILYTLWYLRKRKQRFHLYFGVDNLNAFSGVLLKRLGIVQRVIYYVIDYAPERFRRRPAQALYRMLDRWCCRNCDAVWNVSAAMEQARRLDGIAAGRCAPQIEVPLGNRYDEIPKLPLESRRGGMIVFLGSLTKEQGLELIIEALPTIKKNINNVKLRVIGDGPELNSLKRLAEKKQVIDRIEFMGFVEDDARAAALAAEGMVAVAPYLRKEFTYKRFADPGKVKIYLAAGLPVVISRVPPVADLLQAAGAGVAVEPSVENFSKTLTNLLLSPEKMRAMREEALQLGKSFDWPIIFSRAFERTFELWERKR